MPARRTTDRFLVLDSFRGIAALSVALFHLRLANPVTDSTYVENSILMVDLFFVLSGFVLSHTYFYGRVPDIAGFVSARLARLYPLHLYTLLVYLVFEVLKYAAVERGLMTFNSPAFIDNNAISFLDNLLMTNSFGVLGDKISWNFPAWSISAEFWSNLGFAAVISTLALASRRAFLFLALTACAASAIFLLALGIDLVATGDYGIVRCVYGFSIGMFVYAVHVATDGRRLARLSNDLLEAAALGFFVLIVVTATDGYRMLVPFGFAFVILVFAREAGRISRLLRWRPFVWLGEISYSLYLNHLIVAIIVHKLVDRLVPADNMPLSLAATLAYLALVIAYSHLTYRWIEAPYRRRLKAWLPGASPRRANEAAG